MAKRKVTFEDVMLHPSDLIPDPDNPRINDSAVPALIEGIKKYGFVNPIIVDEDRFILAGHTRLKAALALGMDTVPVRIVHGYSKADKIGFSLSDNKIAELSGWDIPKLNYKLDQIKLEDIDIDMSLFGFDVDDIDSYDDYHDDADDDEDDGTGEFNRGDVVDVDIGHDSCQKVMVFPASQESAEALYERLVSEGYKCRLVD